MPKQTPGELFDPFGAHLRDPYPFYAWARQEQPVSWSGRFGAWLLFRYADVHQALTNTAPDGAVSSVNALRPLTPYSPATRQVFDQGHPPGPEPLTADGQEHRRLRTPFAISARHVNVLEAFVRARADALVDAVAGQRRAEFMSVYAERLPLEVAGHLFGIDPGDLPTVREGCYQAVTVIATAASGTRQAQAAGGLLGLLRLCERYARRRHERPGGDLVSQAVRGLASGAPLSDRRAAWLGRVIAGVLIASHVTTTSAIGAGVHALLADRRQWALLCEDPGRIPDAVEEVLRYAPPTQAFRRRLVRPATFGGVDLPAGADLLPLSGSANRDPSIFEQPEVFAVTRPRPTQHLTFGAGPHYCLGAALARAELRITLEVLTSRLPGLRLGQPQTVTMRATAITRGPQTLHLAW